MHHAMMNLSKTSLPNTGMTMPGYWLVKSIDRFSMYPPSHKSFFSSSYNRKKKFGMLFNGHGLTQLANGHTYVMTEKPYTTAT